MPRLHVIFTRIITRVVFKQIQQMKFKKKSIKANPGLNVNQGFCFCRFDAFLILLITERKAYR